MDVTIVGSGAMARGLATRFFAVGARAQILGRKSENARSLADQLAAPLQVTAGGLGGQHHEGRCRSLAVSYTAAIEDAREIADQVPSRVVVDIANPAGFSTFDGSVVPPDSSAATRDREAPAGRDRRQGVQHHARGGADHGEGGRSSARRADRHRRPGPLNPLSHLIDQRGTRPVPCGGPEKLEAVGCVHMLAQEPIGAQFTSALKIRA
jgi:hypothetical protein